MDLDIYFNKIMLCVRSIHIRKLNEYNVSNIFEDILNCVNTKILNQGYFWQLSKTKIAVKYPQSGYRNTQPQFPKEFSKTLP